MDDTATARKNHWGIVVDHGKGHYEVHVMFDQTADDKAWKPWDRQTAEELAANMNSFIQTGGFVKAVPLTATMQPGD